MWMSILNTATTEQMGYDIVSFFCILALEGMNATVFVRDKERGQKSTTCLKGIPSRREK